MADSDDKNGGPNHLRAWMRFRAVNGATLAERLGGSVTPGMVSDLANSNRTLTSKWLRRIAPILDTTPGMLLDHDPYDLPADMIDIWLGLNRVLRWLGKRDIWVLSIPVGLLLAWYGDGKIVYANAQIAKRRLS